MKIATNLRLSSSVFVLLALLLTGPIAAAEPIKILFLGDRGHHRPADLFKELQPALAERGIELTYTEKMEDISAEGLKPYAGLAIFANIARISPEQEQALLQYVESGRGLIPLHCASFCFQNSQKYIDLVGGQFLRHGTGVFRTTIAAADHPLMKGFDGFESWDETYVHSKHNDKDRTILEFRVDKEGREPWTWVRTQGKGRVFYTAWGHDERTWKNPGFHNLVERGMRWAIGEDPSVVPAFIDRDKFPIPELTKLRTDVKPFEYIDVGANIPNYPAGAQWGKQNAALTMMQKPLPAEESIKHFVTPVGFEPKLFIDENKLAGKPIAMSWDEHGRLWLCLTFDYPNELQPPGKGRDQIVYCTDQDGDGRADEVKVFATKLSIPTSIAFYRNGLIVQDGTETIYLKDTNGDGTADLRKTLITGWSLNDTHGGVSNFQYGLDGWYCGMQGYNNSRPVLTNGKEVQSFRQGFFRFQVAGDGEKTEVTDLEFLRSTDNNTWGFGLSEEGLVFGSTANRNPSVFLPIPNRYYEQVRGMSADVAPRIADTYLFKALSDKVRQVDQHGGYTAGCGHALYTARTYPAEYWNNTAFVCEPTGKLVGTFVLQRDGAGYKSTSPFNLIASNDEWSAPIMAEVGPDGNVWVLDWYNFVIQHNPTPVGFKTGKGNAYESELRDKKHGRVYRVVHSAGKPSTQPSLAEATPEQLVAALKGDNFTWRRHAQRLLIERGNTDVVPALLDLLKNQEVDAIGLNVGAIHALQTLRGLGALDGKNSETIASATAALQSPSAGVRRNALQVLPPSEATTAAILSAGLLEDRDLQVRLAALLALADSRPSVDAARAISATLAKAENANDRWLTEAATIAAARQGLEFLRASNELKTPAQQQLVTLVAGNWATQAPVEQIGSFLSALDGKSPELILAALEGAAKYWPANKAGNLQAADETALMKLLETSPAGAQTYLLTIANRWGSKSLDQYATKIVESLLAKVGDDSVSVAQRRAAARQLIDFRRNDASPAEKLLELLNPRTPPELATGILEAVGRSEAEAVGEMLVSRVPGFTPAMRQTALQVLLSRGEWSAKLIAALEQGSVSLNDLALDQKQALANHPDRKLARQASEMLARGGALPNADRQKVLDELLPLTHMKGDATLGKEVFKKQCSKCHIHSGEGNRIGPDLTGMAVHPKHELLVHIIDPSRSVEGNFRVYTVLTDEGQVINGLLAAETRTTLELFDAEGKKHTIEREAVEQIKASTKSLMPEGFEKQVPPDDIKNLLEFLTQRGKYFSLPLAKVATVVTTKGMFNSEEAEVERLVFRDWSPKTFAGVPFQLVDPQGERMPNAVMLFGSAGNIPPKMPKSVKLPCNSPAKAIHILGGISGWGFPASDKGTTSLIVRLHYADGKTEDHPLLNGEHFADYIRRVDVPGSQFAFAVRGQQVRYLSIQPKREEVIQEVELVKGNDITSPVVMAITVESPDHAHEEKAK